MLFPHPDSPTKAIFLPGSTFKLKLSKTLVFPSYENVTFLKSISPNISSFGFLRGNNV